MMTGMGSGMVIAGVLVLALLILGIAALTKYLASAKSDQSK